MSSGGFPWRVLGLSSDAGATEVRRAYAARLKQLDTAKNAEAFEDLRSAYEAALLLVRAREVVAGAQIQEVATPAGPFKGDADDGMPALVSDHDSTEAEDRSAPFRTMQALVESRDYSVAPWQKLLNDPLLDSPEARLAFEYALVAALSENELQTEFTLSAGKAWRDLIESRYAWVADGIRYTRLFPYYPDLRAALVDLERPTRPIPYSAAPVRDRSGQRTLFLAIVIFALLGMLKLFAQ